MNKKEKLEYKRKWRKKNKESVKESNKKYMEKEEEEKKRYHKKYHKKYNKKKRKHLNKYMRKYRKGREFNIKPIINSANNQIVIHLPKRKLPKKLIDSIERGEQIRIIILGLKKNQEIKNGNKGKN